jgi:hypothetical protein
MVGGIESAARSRWNGLVLQDVMGQYFLTRCRCRYSRFSLGAGDAALMLLVTASDERLVKVPFFTAFILVVATALTELHRF